MNDIKCPYCEVEQEINHEDGYGYAEDTLHEQECGNCNKIFTFTTSISFYYEAYKADCLNGKDHKFKASKTYPIECTKMCCENCEETRLPTESEWIEIKKSS